MDENQGVGRWTPFLSVILLTLLAMSALHWPRPPLFVNITAGVLQPTGVMVHVWVSTADRRLRLARQFDVMAGENDARAAPADVIIDPTRKYQTMVGFGAALTDSSAWLIRNAMSASQRRALLQELFGPPPD